MMNKRHFLALQQLSLILSDALSKCSGVFEQLANEEEVQGAPLASVPAAPAQVASPTQLVIPAVAAAARPEPEGPDLVHVDQVAGELDIHPATLYNLIKKGLLKRHNPFGRSPFVSRMEVLELVRVGHIRRAAPARRGLLTPVRASKALNVGIQTFYKLVKAGEFPNVVKNGRRMEVPQGDIDTFLRSRGFLPPAPAPVVEQAQETEAAVEAGPSVQEQLTTMLGAIEEELHQLQQYLSTMQPDHRASQIAIWAGQMRKISEDLHEVPVSQRAELRTRCSDFSDHLRRIAGEYKLFVNALIFEWTIEDWDLYIRSLSTSPQTFCQEELEVIHQGNLRAINLRRGQVEPDYAKKVIEAARAVLPETDPTLMKVSKAFASRLLTLVPPAPVPVVSVEEEIIEPAENDVSPAAVAITRGKRLLIVGGQGERSAHQDAYMDQLKLTSIEWVTHERNKVIRMRKGLNLKNYDMMLYLNHFTSHATGALVKTAQKNKLPVVKITRGYSVSSIAHAIEEQYSEPVVVKKTSTRRTAERRAHA